MKSGSERAEKRKIGRDDDVDKEEEEKKKNYVIFKREKDLLGLNDDCDGVLKNVEEKASLERKNNILLFMCRVSCLPSLQSAVPAASHSHRRLRKEMSQNKFHRKVLLRLFVQKSCSRSRREFKNGKSLASHLQFMSHYSSRGVMTFLALAMIVDVVEIYLLLLATKCCARLAL